MRRNREVKRSIYDKKRICRRKRALTKKGRFDGEFNNYSLEENIKISIGKHGARLHLAPPESEYCSRCFRLKKNCICRNNVRGRVNGKILHCRTKRT